MLAFQNSPSGNHLSGDVFSHFQILIEPISLAFIIHGPLEAVVTIVCAGIRVYWVTVVRKGLITGVLSLFGTRSVTHSLTP